VGAIPISTSTPYIQNFDGIGTTAAATLPTDFKVDKPAAVRTVGSFSTALTATSLLGGGEPFFVGVERDLQLRVGDDDQRGRIVPSGFLFRRGRRRRVGIFMRNWSTTPARH